MGVSLSDTKVDTDVQGQVKGSLNFERTFKWEFEAKQPTVRDTMIFTGITGKASVTGGLQAGADKKGVYVMPVAEFGGVIATFVLKGSIKFGIVKKTFDKSPPEAPIVKPDKVKFEKENYYLND